MCVASYASRAGVSFHIVRACCALIFIHPLLLHYQKQLPYKEYHGAAKAEIIAAVDREQQRLAAAGGDDDGIKGSLKTSIGNRINEVDGRRGGDVGGHGLRKDGPRRIVVGTTRWSSGRWRAGHGRPGRREEGRERRLQKDRGGKGVEGDARWRVLVFRPVDFLNSTSVVSSRSGDELGI